jgi:hypothetical protein
MGTWIGLLGHTLHAGFPQDALSLWTTLAAGALSGVLALLCKFVLGALDEVMFALDQLGRSLQLQRKHELVQHRLVRAGLRRLALAQKRRRMRKIERRLARHLAEGGAVDVPLPPRDPTSAKPARLHHHHWLCRDRDCPGGFPGQLPCRPT